MKILSKILVEELIRDGHDISVFSNGDFEIEDSTNADEVMAAIHGARCNISSLVVRRTEGSMRTLWGQFLVCKDPGVVDEEFIIDHSHNDFCCKYYNSAILIETEEDK